MQDYSNFDSLNQPWFMSPFFYEILDKYELTEEERELAISYRENGYVIVDLSWGPKENRDFDGIIRAIENKLLEGAVKTQENAYHYSDGPRLFESWKWSKEVLGLCKHPKLLSTLEFLYGRSPRPFQTINFKIGSNQPLHSDVIHFDTSPSHWVAACWVSLEDMDDFNGTLVYVPGSHKLPVYDFQSINLPKAEYGKQFESYAIYEEFIKELVRTTKLDVHKFYARKGQALIWSANLIHGGDKIRDMKRTRWSQAIHYFFPGCSKYHSPMFGNPTGGDYSEKDLSTKDILNHKI